MADKNETEKYFEYRCRKGLERRGLSGRKEYEERLTYEIGVIKAAGFVDYFLVVQDIVNWALSMGIPVGPGRGSGAGSLVSYVLGITHLDPIKYGLIFERFLNPGRSGMLDLELPKDKCVSSSDLTGKEILDILESGGLDDPRLKGI